MAATTLSQYPGKVVALVSRVTSQTPKARRQRLPDLTRSELDKLFDEAHRLSPKNKNGAPSRSGRKDRNVASKSKD